MGVGVRCGGGEWEDGRGRARCESGAPLRWDALGAFMLLVLRDLNSCGLTPSFELEACARGSGLLSKRWDAGSRSASTGCERAEVDPSARLTAAAGR